MRIEILDKIFTKKDKNSQISKTLKNDQNIFDKIFKKISDFTNKKVNVISAMSTFEYSNLSHHLNEVHFYPLGRPHSPLPEET